MKAIMISIQPQYVAKILNGEKTLEIRKTIPQEYLDYCIDSDKKVPIDVYIYCTKARPYLTRGVRGDVYPSCVSSQGIVPHHLNGKVVAKFTLNKVEEIIFGTTLYNDLGFFTCDLYDFDLYKQSCLTKKEMQNYLKVKPNGLSGYAWHIDNLVVFDKPKELKEFKTHLGCNKAINCMFCKYYVFKECTRPRYLTRAPQSWCYIEV